MLMSVCEHTAQETLKILQYNFAKLVWEKIVYSTACTHYVLVLSTSKQIFGQKRITVCCEAEKFMVP